MNDEVLAPPLAIAKGGVVFLDIVLECRDKLDQISSVAAPVEMKRMALVYPPIRTLR